MRSGVLAIAVFAAACAGEASSPPSEDAVLAPVRAFYAAYDAGFPDAADYATDDWNHINPLGGRTRSKEETLDGVREVHSTFLKGVTDTIQSADVRFASEDVAVVTVLSRTSPHPLPNDPEVRPHGQIRTFVVVKRGSAWRIMQDHNTEVGDVPAGEAS
jgi:uncharacterized protein (TIGR02246 family)